MPKAANVEELLKSGAHFGHLTRRWNPKMKEFIFMQRNGIHIIDLKKSQKYLQEALDEVTKLARAGKTILFVGTKKQAQEIVKTEAIRCGMPFVTHRWLGGMLTNFSTVRKSISRMEEIEKMKTDGTVDELTKKEGLMLDREQEKLELTLGGIANMTRIPGAIFVVDTIKEHIAINEAVKLNIPIISMVDTNSDPDIPDHIIPSNDDSARTIQLVTAQIADAIIEGNAEREAIKEEELMEEAAAEAKKDTGSDSEQEEKKEVKAGKSTKRRKRRRKASDSDSKDQSEESSEDKAETSAEDQKDKSAKDQSEKSAKSEADESTKKDDDSAKAKNDDKKEEEKKSDSDKE
ncbi:30S ribosomal protein S2 [Rhodohalobacter sp.]|uniref:30S ribosomal protein S2 n=1 Tax=Rhodohalobacter sp. TaxID=1974210 RepID=UPI002ACDFF63|nr:30S ribosomal protein S2 [Rhodohalobacter sp.]MDZ7755389.1 30S ribosomal protein S2 [Rhodohalobacter sp.]